MHSPLIPILAALVIVAAFLAVAWVLAKRNADYEALREEWDSSIYDDPRVDCPSAWENRELLAPYLAEQIRSSLNPWDAEDISVTHDEGK